MLVSASEIKQLSSTVAAIKTMKPDQTTWNAVSTRIIEEMNHVKSKDNGAKNKHIIGSAKERKVTMRKTTMTQTVHIKEK